MKRIYKNLRDERVDKWIVSSILFASIFICFDLFSKHFSWIEFHERDFSKVANFILGKGLSYIGPEMIGGGNLPGPGLTLLLAIPTLLFKSPVGVHILMQFCFVATAGLTFVLVKRHLNRTIAYLSLVFLLSNLNYVFFSFVGWHAGFISVVNVLILFCYDRYLVSNNKSYLFIAGILLGFGIQIHMSLLLLYIVYPLGLLYLRIRNLLSNQESLKILFLSILGILFSLSYYFYYDYQNDFNNSLQFINMFSTENFRNLERLEIYGSLFSFDWILMHSWWQYPTFVSYKFMPAFLWFTSQFWRIPSIGELFGFIFLTWVFLGLCLVFYSEYTDKEKFKWVTVVLLVILAFPIFSRAWEARFYLITHPAFEVLLAISTYQIISKLQLYRKTRILIIIGLMLAVTNNIFGMVLVKTVRNSEDGINISHTTIKAKKSNTVYSNNYHTYWFLDDLMDVLVSQLKIPPKIFNERFYLFSGKENFYKTYVLPSVSHYELAYYAIYPNVKNISLETNGDYGIILVRNRDVPNFNSKTLDVFKVEKVGNFTAYYYRGPYFYYQEHYNETSHEERRIKERKPNSVVVNKTENDIYVDAVLEALVPFKTLKYLHKIILKTDSENSLIGYTEIVSSDLRQLEWEKESPYFIKEPAVKLLFRDGTHVIIPVMSENFYSRVEKETTGWEMSIYERHGQNDEVRNLGNYYVYSPYGVSIELPSRKISDIESVIFLNDGYNTIIPIKTLENKFFYNKEVISKAMRKEVNL